MKTTKTTKTSKATTTAPTTKRKAPMSATARRERWREWGKAYRARKAAKDGRTLQAPKVRKTTVGAVGSTTALGEPTTVDRIAVGSLAALVDSSTKGVRHLFKVVFANDCRARVQLLGEDRAVVIKGEERGYSPIFWDISPKTLVLPVIAA